VVVALRICAVVEPCAHPDIDDKDAPDNHLVQYRMGFISHDRNSKTLLIGHKMHTCGATYTHIGAGMQRQTPVWHDPLET